MPLQNQIAAFGAGECRLEISRKNGRLDIGQFLPPVSVAAVMSSDVKFLNFHAAGDIPQSQRIVLAGGSERLAVGKEREGDYLPRMTRKDSQQLAGFGVP